MLSITLYLAIGIFCAMILIVSMLFGADGIGDADVDLGFGDAAAGVSPLSLPVMMMWGSSFGCFGALFTSMGWGSLAVPMGSAGVATLLSAVFFVVVYKVFVKTQSSSDVRYTDYIGRYAITTIPIKGGGDNGQVLLSTAERGRTVLIASADEDIPKDTDVVIKEVIGSKVKVERKTNATA